MSRWTTLGLLLVVGALGALAYRQARYEVEHPEETQTALFAGVEPTRVRAFRLENLERSIHVRLERTDAGVWFLTDPIAYPAEPAVVEQVFELIAGNLAGPVPEVLADPAKAGLAPVRGFLEVEEELEGAGGAKEVRRTRVSLGDVDLDGQRVFVLRDGAVLRTARNLETLLSRDVPDLRSRRLFRVDPNGVIEVQRKGRIYLPDAIAPDATLQLRAEGAGWRMYAPIRAHADAEYAAAFTRALATLVVERFVTDIPGADLAPYGLAPAWFSVTLVDRHGASSTLEIGQDAGQKTFAKFPEQPHVFQLGDFAWNTLVDGVGDLPRHLEVELFRVRRDHLDTVELVRGARVTRLRRAPDGAWTVAEKVPEQAEFGLEQPAEAATVERFLTDLEATKIGAYLLERKAADVLPTDGAPDALWVTPLRDLRQGGWLGARVRTAEGTELRSLVREGEDVVAGVDVAIDDLLARGVDHFLRRLVWDVSEPQLRELAFTRGERTKRYVRGDGFTWRPIDAAVPARELRQLLDSILFLKADGEVPPAAREPLTDTVRIELVDAEGQALQAELGRNAAGAVELSHGLRRARALDQGLLDAIAALFD